MKLVELVGGAYDGLVVAVPDAWWTWWVTTSPYPYWFVPEGVEGERLVPSRRREPGMYRPREPHEPNARGRYVLEEAVDE